MYCVQLGHIHLTWCLSRDGGFKYSSSNCIARLILASWIATRYLSPLGKIRDLVYFSRCRISSSWLPSYSR